MPSRAARLDRRQFHNLLSPVIAALFAGNAIVVKSSEATAWSSSYFARIATGALVACGHSPQLVQSVVCWPATANHLTAHPGIAHITFIGSRPVAHHVCASAAKALTPVCVELGGKDPALVLDDLAPAELRRVASILMRGVFQSAGQNCVGIERVIAMPKAYAALVDVLTPRIRALRPGSALDAAADADAADAPAVDVGACISAANFDRLEALIADAVAHGARLLAGGRRYAHPAFPRGHYFAPTLVADVTPDMAIARTELFAPVCVLMRAASPAAAVAAANDSAYALGASVFGPPARAAACASDLHAGMVAVNDFAVYYAVQLPFGGAKASGYGRFAGPEGLRALCNTKAVSRDRWPSLVRTAIPAPLDIPFDARGPAAADRAWRFACAVIRLAYGSAADKAAAVRALLRAAWERAP